MLKKYLISGLLLVSITAFANPLGKSTAYTLTLAGATGSAAAAGLAAYGSMSHGGYPQKTACVTAGVAALIAGGIALYIGNKYWYSLTPEYRLAILASELKILEEQMNNAENDPFLTGVFYSKPEALAYIQSRYDQDAFERTNTDIKNYRNFSFSMPDKLKEISTAIKKELGGDNKLNYTIQSLLEKADNLSERVQKLKIAILSKENLIKLCLVEMNIGNLEKNNFCTNFFANDQALIDYCSHTFTSEYPLVNAQEKLSHLSANLKSSHQMIAEVCTQPNENIPVYFAPSIRLFLDKIVALEHKTENLLLVIMHNDRFLIQKKLYDLNKEILSLRGKISGLESTNASLSNRVNQLETGARLEYLTNGKIKTYPYPTH